MPSLDDLIYKKHGINHRIKRGVLPNIKPIDQYNYDSFELSYGSRVMALVTLDHYYAATIVKSTKTHVCVITMHRLWKLPVHRRFIIPIRALDNGFKVKVIEDCTDIHSKLSNGTIVTALKFSDVMTWAAAKYVVSVRNELFHVRFSDLALTLKQGQALIDRFETLDAERRMNANPNRGLSRRKRKAFMDATNKISDMSKEQNNEEL